MRIHIYKYISQLSNGFDHERVYIARKRSRFDLYVVRVYLILVNRLRFFVGFMRFYTCKRKFVIKYNLFSENTITFNG